LNVLHFDILEELDQKGQVLFCIGFVFSTLPFIVNKKIYLRRTMHPPFHAIAKSQQARLLLKMGKKNAILA